MSKLGKRDWNPERSTLVHRDFECFTHVEIAARVAEPAVMRRGPHVKYLSCRLRVDLAGRPLTIEARAFDEEIMHELRRAPRLTELHFVGHLMNDSATGALFVVIGRFVDEAQAS